jgi:hypothetical protein
VIDEDDFAVGRNRQGATQRHGVPGIYGQVKNCHFNLTGIDHGRGQAGADIQDHANLRTRNAADQVGHTRHEPSNVD